MTKTTFIYQNALDVANGYKETAEGIYKKLSSKRYLVNSFVTNGIFAIELYLKIILKTSKNQSISTHKLDKLYNLIDQNIKDELEKSYKIVNKNNNLYDVLNKYKDAFENFRYSYEGYNSDGTINKEKVGLFANTGEIFNILQVFCEYCNKNCKEVNFCDRDKIKYINRK